MLLDRRTPGKSPYYEVEVHPQDATPSAFAAQLHVTRASDSYRSRVSFLLRARETQISIAPAARSALLSRASRWSASPAKIVVRQTPQIPCSHPTDTPG